MATKKTKRLLSSLLLQKAYIVKTLETLQKNKKEEEREEEEEEKYKEYISTLKTFETSLAAEQRLVKCQGDDIDDVAIENSLKSRCVALSEIDQFINCPHKANKKQAEEHDEKKKKSEDEELFLVCFPMSLKMLFSFQLQEKKEWVEDAFCAKLKIIEFYKGCILQLRRDHEETMKAHPPESNDVYAQNRLDVLLMRMRELEMLLDKAEEATRKSFYLFVLSLEDEVFKVFKVVNMFEIEQFDSCMENTKNYIVSFASKKQKTNIIWQSPPVYFSIPKWKNMFDELNQKEKERKEEEQQ